MTAQTLLHDLTARGVRVWAEADRLKLDAPIGVLTDQDKAKLASYKADLLAALSPKPGTCPKCGAATTLQDRTLDAWFCPGCRVWCDGQGQALPPVTGAELQTSDGADARQLLDDLLAAGCGFVFDDGELRLTQPGKMSSALWVRFENSGPEFQRLALELARSFNCEESQWVN